MTEGMTCPHCETQCQAEHNFCPSCGFPVSKLRESDDPFIGRTLPGGHVVLELIDVGGMGRIYRAEQKVLGRTVAVKVIHPHLCGDEQVETRFITEARAASRLNHPHSVGVIDFGKIDDRFYMVMEYLRGRDLATIVHQEGLLAISRLVEVICQVLGALEEAHHLGIVHRDLKPENVVLEPLRSGGDFVKVLDFGLAQVREAAQQRPTSDGKGRRTTLPGTVCGTPEYMAPEQARGEAIDHRVDLYACGVMLFESLTGRLPFEAPTSHEVVLQHLSAMPPDPRALAPERHIPVEIVDVVMKALAKDPSERWQSAAQMADALRRALERPASSTRHRSGEMLLCDACEALVPRTQRFCGDCGAPMKRRRTTPPPAHLATIADHETDPGGFPLPFVSRDDELAWLFEQRDAVQAQLRAAEIVGPDGIGKTRLLTELLRVAEREGDVIVSVGPDPWCAGLGYFALREAIVQLADLPDDGGGPHLWMGASPEARAGLAAVFARRGERPSQPGRRWSDLPPDEEATGQRLLACEALSWAIAKGLGRADGRAVLLAVDDVAGVDGGSRNAFADLVADPPPGPVLFLATRRPGFEDADWTRGWANAARLALEGIRVADAALLLGADEAALEARPAEGRVPPMYVEQLVRFTQEGGEDPPSKLGDLLALRFEHLPPDARKVLQAVAVLGDAAPAVQLVALLPEVTDLGRYLQMLRLTGFLTQNENEIGSSHPLVRDVVLASMPREVRRQLHERARRDFGVESLQIPIEAHALHAYHAEETFDALMLLEHCATRARTRGDWRGSVRALGMAVDIARRELSRGQLDDPVGALVLFSCKLGEALAHAGQLGDAEGVLREALDIAGPTALERPRLLGAMARVQHALGRQRDADDCLEEALLIATADQSHELIESLERLRRSWAESA